MTYDSFRFDVDGEGIAHVVWDMPGRSMNVLSAKSIAEYISAIERIVTDGAVKGAVIGSGKRDFIAGADLPMVEAMAETAQSGDRKAAAEKIFHEMLAFQMALRRLEACGKPVAAALPGTALGGGLEVALATHHRVVADNPKAQLGLPESKVGLMPGAGGTQRLVRLLGAMAAAPLLLEGRALDPAKALSLGIVNEVVPAGREREAALAFVRANLAEGEKVSAARAAGTAMEASYDPVWDKKGYKILGGGPFSPQGFPVFMGAGAMVRKESYGIYDAQKAILSAVYEGLQVPFETALRIEVRYFTSLVCGAQARNMIRSLFVNKQALEKGARRPAGVADQSVKRLGVLGGGGFMGAGIANVAAAAGIEVVVLDRDEESAAKAKAHAERLASERVAKGRMSEAAAGELLSRITTTADYLRLAGCELVVEAVFESPDVKKAVTEAAEAHLGADAVFASNTSTIPISLLARNSARPTNFIGIHFFSPVEKMPLVEIILGKGTGEVALAKALDFVRQLRKTPIVVNDARFFYANRCVLKYVEEAHHMLAEGVAPALIENAARMIGMPVGPLSLNDETALDLGLKIRQATRAGLGDGYQVHPAEERLDRMVTEMGRLGRKNRKGFYDYPEAGRKRLWPGLADLFAVANVQPDVEALKRRFLTIQAVEAIRALEEGVVTDVREADIGAIFGWGFAPWSGGPISYVDTRGPAVVVADCRALAADLGARFAPPRLLEEVAGQGTTFYRRQAARQAAAA